MITGTHVGGSSTFKANLLPAGAALPAGASLSVVWTCDDPAAVLTPSADTLSVSVSIPATDAQGSAPAGSAPSYNLTATGTSSALTAPIVGTANVPLLPPLPNAIEIDQTA